jgi:hypothetical protein
VQELRNVHVAELVCVGVAKGIADYSRSFGSSSPYSMGGVCGIAVPLGIGERSDSDVSTDFLAPSFFSSGGSVEAVGEPVDVTVLPDCDRWEFHTAPHQRRPVRDKFRIDGPAMLQPFIAPNTRYFEHVYAR